MNSGSCVVTGGKTDMEKLTDRHNFATFLCESTREEEEGNSPDSVMNLKKKKKRYSFPFYATKAYRGSRSIAQIILNLGTIRK